MKNVSSNDKTEKQYLLYKEKYESSRKQSDRLALRLGLSGKGFAKDDAPQAFREIKSRQQAVAELAGKPEFCMELETRARRLRSIGYEKSVEIMDTFFLALETKSNTPMVFRICMWMFPVLALSSLFLALAGIYRQQAMPLFFLLAFAQLMAAFLGLYRNNRVLSPVYRMNRAAAAYRELFQLLERESFESPYLMDLRSTLLRDGAASSLKELEAISDSVSARHNVYAFVLYNSLFLHDYHCVMRFEAWKDTYRDKLEAWFQTVGDVEALISLSVVCHTRRVHCLPELVDCGRPVLAAADLRHPLLKGNLAVGNDVELAHRVCIITGSNMSGKTTFMRSIGVNLSLAYAGGFCTAGSLQVSLMKLCTSIRTEDNVHEGISTFYAELLRVKRMMEASGKQIPMISLIDEIYKGTNSKDRIFAARETIRKLSKPWSFTLLTTHDFELCDLEHDAETDAGNYYFTEHYEDNQICFDYKLRDGRATTTNARYLLRMAGIIS